MKRTRSSLLPLSLLLVVPACDHGGGGGSKTAGDEPPTVSFAAPTDATSLALGESVEIRWTADDADSEARTTLLAVGLDVSATIELVADVPELDGVEQSFTWTPVAGQEGTYRIDARVEDDASTVVGSAPGTVGVGAVDYVEGAAVLGTGGLVLGTAAFEDGSYVVGGYFQTFEPLVLDPGGVNETVLESQGLDGFVAKYSREGELLWADQTHGLGFVVEGGGSGALGIASFRDAQPLPGGGCVVSMITLGTVTVDPGGPQERTYARDSNNGLLLCYDSAGNLAWSRAVAEADDEYTSATLELALAPDGTLALYADQYGPLTFDLGEDGETTLEPPGSFTARFDLAGAFLEARTLGDTSAGDSYGTKGFSTALGGWAAGVFVDRIVFPGGAGGEVQLDAIGDEDDLYLVHHAPDGTLAWVSYALGVTLGSSSYATLAGFTVDEAGNATLLSGQLEEGEYRLAVGTADEVTVSVGPDETAVVLAGFDVTGRLRWHEVFRSEAFLLAVDEEEAGPTALAHTEDGDVVLTFVFEEYVEAGDFRLEQDLGPGLGSVLVARYSPDGQRRWAQNDGGLECEPYLVSIEALTGDRILLQTTVEGDTAEFGTSSGESQSFDLAGLPPSLVQVVYQGDGSF